jgi:biotin carboxyl carrier protein
MYRMENAIYKIAVDGDEMEVHTSTAQELDSVYLGEGVYHILVDKVSYKVKLDPTTARQKQFSIEVNGTNFAIDIADHFDILVKKMGLSTISQAALTSIFSPMPGLIHEVLVKAGDTISKGDPLLILEAMKMENILKAEGNGIVKEVKIAKGNTVEKNQLLIELE